MKTHSPTVEDLMNTYAPALLRYAERLVRDPHAAQDVLQDVFIRYARLKPARRPAASATRAWLYRAVHHRAVDLIRGEQRRRHLHQTHAELEDANRKPPTPHRRQAVLEALHVLNEKERTVFLLRLQEGLSYREIHQVTGLKEGHIGYLLHQAVRTLSQTLHPEDAS